MSRMSDSPKMDGVVRAEEREMDIIILLSGWSQAGKDTFADFLISDYGFTKYAFANAAKRKASKKYGFPLELAHTQEGKASMIKLYGIVEYPFVTTTPGSVELKPKSVRDCIIEIANKEREKDPMCWANQECDQIKSEQRTNSPSKIIISDWRFLPELFAVQKQFPNAKIIPVKIQNRHQLISPVPHYSEYELTGFPFRHIINNDEDLVVLKQLARSFYTSITTHQVRWTRCDDDDDIVSWA